MKKISETAQKRLICQAAEARDFGMEKLAEAIESALYNNDLVFDTEEFSHSDLEDYVYHSLWRNASAMMAYHNVEKPNAEEVNDKINELKRIVVAGLEDALKIKEAIGPFEPIIPGEDRNLKE